MSWRDSNKLCNYKLLPVNFNHLLLANTMATSLSLKIILRIPIAVVDNDCIGCCKVNSQSTSFGAKQKDETIRIWFAVSINSSLSHVTTNSAVESFVRIFSKQEMKAP